ncbi:MAG: SHOCT domain-containing protein, partial [Pseudomonadota bacterium]|nr:SHOCT domain-containing protein [Pseudomonadota bacterium]
GRRKQGVWANGKFRYVQSIAPTNGLKKSNISKELSKLKDLFDQGLIDKQEYKAKKKEILKRF